jgi:hypothetical protein
VIVDLLKQFDPQSDGLLRRISEYVNDDMLKCISMADYGQDVDCHLAALRLVRDIGAFPQKMYWCPAEVLELIRWSEPEDPDWKPGESGEFGHWMRAFCCAALLRATREPWNYGDGLGTDSTLVQLIFSLCALPIDFTSEAVSFLAWLLMHSDPEGRDVQVCAYGVGLFWFALKHPAHFPDESLISLAQWVIRRPDEICESPASALRRADAVSEGHPAIDGDGLREMVLGCQKRSAWEVLALKFTELDLSARSTDLQKWVRVVAEKIIELGAACEPQVLRLRSPAAADDLRSG